MTGRDSKKGTRKEPRVIKLKNEIVSYYQHLFTLKPKATHIILHSGRGVTKSTFFSIWDLWRLLQTPNCDMIVLGYEFSSMKKKVFADYKFAAKEILHIPEAQIEFHETEMGELWVKIRNKWGTNKIWFEHVKGGPESLKGLRPTPGNKWIAVRFYELTNFQGWSSENIENTISTFIRNCHGNIIWDKIKDYCNSHNLEYKDNNIEWLEQQEWYYKDWDRFMESLFCVTYEFNTPSAGVTGGSWVLDWLEVKKKERDTYYQFNTYLDMTEKEKFKFLRPQALRQIENVKNNDPITYNHVYLGKMPYDGDLTFPLLNKNQHCGKFENFEPDVLCIGVDVGRSDATVCTLNGFSFREKDLQVALGMHCWYHCNRKAEFIKDGVRCRYTAMDLFQTATMILDFCEMVHKEYPTAYIYFQMDYANEGKAFYDVCFPYNQTPMWLNVNKSWVKILPEKRIDLINALTTVPECLKFYDVHTYEAYKHQVWGKMGPNGERKRLDDPTKPLLDMDRQDACEYGIVKELYKVIMDRINYTSGKWEPKYMM